MNLRELADAMQQLTDWLRWERDTLEEFHRYAHMFGCQPGSNVFTFVLAECACRICHQPLGYECADGERKYFIDPDRSSGYVHGDCLAAKLLRLRYPRASLIKTGNLRR